MLTVNGGYANHGLSGQILCLAKLHFIRHCSWHDGENKRADYLYLLENSLKNTHSSCPESITLCIG